MAEPERACGGGFMATSLQKAAKSGDVKSLVLALECTATNVDAPDADGNTALMIAARNGFFDLVDALCNAGADPTSTDGNGETAEQIATAAGQLKCAARLSRASEQRSNLMTMIGLAGPEPPKQRTAEDDVMAKLLAEAGLPKGPAECPF